MLAEGFVALIALVTVMIMTQDEIRGLSPGTIYGNGIGRFLTILIGEEHLPFAMTFGAMAFSTFVFDTLDVSTRLGRYIVQELTRWKGRTGAAAAAVLTISLPAFFLSFAEEGSWVKFWTLFGASNQLLAALTLTAVSVWLVRTRKFAGFTIAPMLFVLTTTLWALARLAVANLRASKGLDVALVNALAATLLIALALYLLVSAARVMTRERRAA
jgi:carbon starvation protein